MITNGNAHLYAPFFQALLEGKSISLDGEILEKVSFNAEIGRYAIVEPKGWYRVVLLQRPDGGSYPCLVHTERFEADITNDPRFICWLDERKVYDIPAPKRR